MANGKLDTVMEVGTFTPQLFDYDTYIKDLPAQTYYKVGDLVFGHILVDIGTESFSVMLQIRNLPYNCHILMGNVSGVGQLSHSDIAAHYIQTDVTDRLYIRPNITGSVNGYVMISFIGRNAT